MAIKSDLHKLQNGQAVIIPWQQFLLEAEGHYFKTELPARVGIFKEFAQFIEDEYKVKVSQNTYGDFMVRKYG